MKPTYQFIFLAICSLMACNSDDAESNDLADSLVGTYIGTFTNPDNSIMDYSVTVSKVSSMEIQITPTNGTIATTFNAELEEENIGTVSTIQLIVSEDILENNGTFAESSGQLSYSFHLGGTNPANIDAFIGLKQ